MFCDVFILGISWIYAFTENVEFLGKSVEIQLDLLGEVLARVNTWPSVYGGAQPLKTKQRFNVFVGVLASLCKLCIAKEEGRIMLGLSCSAKCLGLRGNNIISPEDVCKIVRGSGEFPWAYGFPWCCLYIVGIR